MAHVHADRSRRDLPGGVKAPRHLLEQEERLKVEESIEP